MAKFACYNENVKIFIWRKKEEMLMKEYLTPAIEVTLLSQQDILNGSEVLINGSDLFGTSEGDN